MSLPGLKLLAMAALLASVAACLPLAAQAQEGVAIPPPAMDVPLGEGETATAVFAGGCFWGVQGVFQHVEGVRNAVSGYAGGDARSASYSLVSSGATEHAEAVEITYDPARISYGKLLQIFFSAAHDPTQLDRQGPDIGRHYRSAIFPADEEQARIADAYMAQLDREGAFTSAIVTRIEPGHAFYRAEDYHQDYMTLNPTQPYIAYYDLPKIDNLKRLFPELYRDDPVLVSEAGKSG